MYLISGGCFGSRPSSELTCPLDKLLANQTIHFSAEQRILPSDIIYGIIGSINMNPTNSLFQGSNKFFMRTLFWNAGGLTNVKFTELKKIIIEENADMIGIVEAGASTDSPQFYQLRGYQTYILKRARQVACGIMVLVKSSLVCKFEVLKEMTVEDRMEAVRVDIWKNKCYKRFFICYNPPGNKPNLHWLEENWNEKSLLYGDLNAHSHRWGYTDTTAVGRIVEDFIDENPVQYIENVEQSATFLTSRGQVSHPDIILSHPNIAEWVEHNLLFSPGGTGHKILAVGIKARHRRDINIEKRRTRWNTKKANWARYSALTNDFVTENLVNGDVDASCNAISSAILKCALEAVPRGQVKRYSPFWNNQLDKLKNERDAARKQADESHRREDVVVLNEKNARLKRCIIDSKRKTVGNFLQNLDFRKDSAKAHQFVSNLEKDIGKKNQPIVFQSKELTCPKKIANNFTKYFSKIGNFKPIKENRKSVTVKRQFINMEETDLFDDIFTIDELNIALKQTKKGKSPGPDGILPDFLTNVGTVGKKAILKLLNLVWCKHYPSTWRKAEIVPLLKKGKQANLPGSYRPIALTSSFSKLFERLVLKRLTLYLEKHKLISQNQAGFRKHRSTMEQVARFTQEVKDGFHRKQHTLAVFVDFSNAFDRVWRKKLLSKLQNLRIGGKLYSAIASFFSQRFIRTKYQDCTSTFRQVKQGLPQGSVLSPTLFNVMVDDLSRMLEDILGLKVALYADDLVMWATGSNPKALEDCLNKALASLQSWTEVNEMKVNTTKTVYQLFTMSTKNHLLSLQFNGEELPRTNAATYLGVKLDTKLNMLAHIEDLVGKGERRLNLLKRLAGKKWGSSQDVLKLAYKSYVLPAMEYGHEIVATASKTALEKLEKTQNKALRLITGGPSSTPIAAMQLQTGIEPLENRRDMACLRLYERVRRSPTDYWSCYRTSTQRLKTQKTFICHVKEITESLQLDLNNREMFMGPKDLQRMVQIHCNLHLTQDVKKRVTPEWEMKAIALETISTRYPSPEWLHVYTDGSALMARLNAGAGVYSSSFQLSAPVGKISTNYDGELAGILMALDKVKNGPWDRIAVFVDSLAALQAVAGVDFTESQIIFKCRAAYDEAARNGKVIVLQWIPGHCGVFGNEKADELAKKGAEMEQPDEPMSFHTLKRVVSSCFRSKVKCTHQEKAVGKKWRSLLDIGGRIPPNLPRKVGVACFRMLTGHDYLQAHLYRIGVVEYSTCPLCEDGEMTADHLNACASLEDTRQNFISDDIFIRRSILYWEARRRMAELPRLSDGVD